MGRELDVVDEGNVPDPEPEGSTAYSKEKEVYGLFVKYIRQVASGGRPPVTLSSILIFVTGAAEEPVLGFTKQPTITFVNGHAIHCDVSPSNTLDSGLPWPRNCKLSKFH